MTGWERVPEGSNLSLPAVGSRPCPAIRPIRSLSRVKPNGSLSPFGKIRGPGFCLADSPLKTEWWMDRGRDSLRMSLDRREPNA